MNPQLSLEFPSEPIEKYCLRCLVVKPYSEFYIRRKSPDGFMPHCKECAKSYKKNLQSKWQSKQSSKDGKVCTQCNTWKPLSEFHKHNIMKDGHRSDCKECCCSVVGQYIKTRTETDPEYAEHRRKIHLKSQNRTRAKVRIRVNNYQAQKKASGGKILLHEWNALCDKFNRKCLKCGRQEPEIQLTMDHIIPLSKGGSNFIDNIQPLCKSCNCSNNDKHIDYRAFQS